MRNNSERFSVPDMADSAQSAKSRLEQFANTNRNAPVEPVNAPTSPSNPLDFVVPRESVELPSRGRFYPSTHPFYNKEFVEIKYMTAKEEDILTSRTMLKQGVTLDRLLESILVESVDPVDLS